MSIMWNVIGHPQVVERLGRAVESNRLSHSLLLTGAVGVGKTRLALELAKVLNCIGPAPPCQQCIHCRQIEGGSHPDVVVVASAEGKDSISIGQVRELRESASLLPFQGRRKVYIIDGAGSLTLPAADALLKTLEEPQSQLTMILTAPDIDALPATVVSRCSVIDLHPVDSTSIARALEQRGVPAAEAERIALLARGSPGWALRAVSQPKIVAQKEQSIEQLCSLFDLGLEARLQLAETLAAERKDRASIRRNLETMTLLARDLLLLKNDLPSRLVSGRQAETLRAQGARLNLAQIMSYLNQLRVTMDRIDRNVDPRLALEALMVSLP